MSPSSRWEIIINDKKSGACDACRFFCPSAGCSVAALDLELKCVDIDGTMRAC